MKVLSVKEPMVNCYRATSDAVAILYTNKKNYPWLLSNFIQLFEVKKDVLDFFDFAIENNPFLIYSEIDYSLILKKYGSINDFL